jgi:predicted flap endonuclease-1-like 5' DNA nuclease
MKGAVVFLIVFFLVTMISMGTEFPPGRDIYYAIGAVDVDYPILGIPVATLVPAIFNGLIYGFIVYVIFSVISSAAGKGKKEEGQTIKQTVNVDVSDKGKTAETKEEPKKEKIEELKMGLDIIKIERIGPKYAEKLAEADIKTTDDLLHMGKTRKGRDDIAIKTGISSKLILEWVNLADLIRIKGVSEEYSDLLEEAGVDTVVELARRNPDNLHTKIVEVNKEKNLVRQIPSLKTVANWVEQAKKLPRAVEY